MQQAAPLQAARLAQVTRMDPRDIDQLVQRIRRADSMPKLGYHATRHAEDVGAGSAQEYLEALRAHLARADLRVFTYLRTKDRTPIWELVAPDTGTTVMYHEERSSLWSFFRPVDVGARMANAETWWVEAIRTPTGWRFEERWRWRP
jgi:hypothetical protein